MKKIIKVLSFVLFIIFVLGITTSNAAYTVNSETTSKTMLEQLNAGNPLTGISNAVRDSNESLFCTNRYIAQVDSAKYAIVSSVSYPSVDKTSGYARAYILAVDSSKFSKEEKQNAWWYLNGQSSTSNDLVTVANAYQNYINNEKTDVEFILNKDEVSTKVENSKIIYGPVQIKYSYKKGQGASKFDEWGGFNYAIFDSKGNNISSKVELCELNNNVYQKIQTTKNAEGFYEVRTADYNMKELYIVTEDKKIETVTIKIQENEVNYTANVYNLEGKYESDGGIVLCDTCKNNKVDDGRIAVLDTTKLFVYNNAIYKYNNTSTSYKYNSSYIYKNLIKLEGVSEEVKLGMADRTNQRTGYVLPNRENDRL